MPVRAIDHGVIASSGGGIVDGAYWIGGYNSARAVQKTLFGTDATSTLAATLSVNTAGFAGFGNGAVAGYSGGNDIGSGPFANDVIDKQLFADETNTTLGATLSEVTWGESGAANSGTAGYFAGGQGRVGGTTSVLLDKIDKLLFADDSCAEITPTLSQTCFYGTSAGAANGSTAAYWFGGSVSGGSTDRIDKTAFSDDSTSDSGSDISTAATYGAACANSGTAAYTAIGHDGSGTKVVNKLTFSDDSVSNLGNLFDANAYGRTAAAQKGTHGYFAGAYSTDSTGYIDVIEKLTFSGEGMAAITPTLAAASGFQAGFACDSGL